MAYAIRLPANRVLERTIEDLLTRPRGRPSHALLVRYRSFPYQAASWSRPRRVIAKIEHHLGELFPRVGFIVTTLTGTNRRVAGGPKEPDPGPARSLQSGCRQGAHPRRAAQRTIGSVQPHGVPKALRTDTVIVMSDHRLQRAWQVLRREGLRSFWFKFLGVLGYRRLFLLSRSLTEPIPAVSASLALTMNWLTPAELTEYLAFRSATGAEQIADRLKRNQRCLVARAQGRWVGAMWADTQRAWIEYLERELPLAPGEVYLFDAYTNPAFRGQAIAPAMSAELLRRFRDEGCPRALRGTLPENLAALRAHAKAGFQTYALMGRIKIGPWRHDFLTVRASRAQIT